MVGDVPHLRCLSSCKLREFCQSPANCAAWLPHSLSAFRERCRSPRLAETLLGVVVVILIAILAALAARSA